MKLIIHSQTSAVQPLKFGNGYVIHSIFYKACDYLSMLGFKLNHVSKRGPGAKLGYGKHKAPVMRRAFPRHDVTMWTPTIFHNELNSFVAYGYDLISSEQRTNHFWTCFDQHFLNCVNTFDNILTLWKLNVCSAVLKLSRNVIKCVKNMS